MRTAGATRAVHIRVAKPVLEIAATAVPAVPAVHAASSSGPAGQTTPTPDSSRSNATPSAWMWPRSW